MYGCFLVHYNYIMYQPMHSSIVEHHWMKYLWLPHVTLRVKCAGAFVVVYGPR